MLELVVRRASIELSGRGLAFLEPSDMEQDGIRVDDVVELRVERGRSILARVGPPSQESPGRGFIRIDRYLREGLKARVGDRIKVEKAEAKPIRRMFLIPLLDVTKVSGLTPYLVQTLSSRRMLASPNSLLYASLPGASLSQALPSGCPFRVAAVQPGPGLITTETAIELTHAPSGIQWEMEVTFDDVGGMEKEVQLIREVVELPLRYPETYRHLGINPPRGIILHGPPGVGKTYLAKAIAKEMEASFFYINGPDIVGSAYGETEGNLRRIFHEAGDHAPSIILVDELDVLSPKRGESGTQADARMSTQFLALLDGVRATEGVMVIGTTNRIEVLDASFRRPGRFDREIFIGPPDVKGRLEILRVHTRAMPLRQEAEDYLEEVARRTLGFVGADIMELCREAALNCLRRNMQLKGRDIEMRGESITLEMLTVERQDFEAALTRIRPSALRETYLTPYDVSWEDVGGLKEVKERLRRVVELPLLHPDVFSAMKLNPPKGVLLYGPPGTGKTLLAKAIARECRANFISVKGSELLSPWMGQSEEKVSHIFQIARQVAPAIIFFDQLDTIAPRRGVESVTTRVMERVVTQILTELDGMEPLTGVVVVGATNRIDLLDPALLAPGRLGVHILLALPNEKEREEILAVHLRDTPLEEPRQNLSGLVASKTEGYSGADLRALCQEAKMIALGAVNYQRAAPLKLGHFLEALEAMAHSRHQEKD